jgi:hypothetical protein
MARPNLRRLLWVHSSARLNHVGGSRAAMCLEKVIYSKASTVVRTPTGWSRNPRYTVRTPKVGPGPPRVQAGPLEWDLDPPGMGSGPPTKGPQGPRTEHIWTLNRT